MDAPYAMLEPLEPGIARVLAHNPSAFTFTGTQTYLIGEARGRGDRSRDPPIEAHLDALEAAIGGRPVAAILCTHTHRDHSPASRPLADRTGAPIIGCAPLSHPREPVWKRASTRIIRPIACSKMVRASKSTVASLIAVATPGHTSNHLCFAYGDALFSGDHVMGWSTTVVVPPDGDMADYMASLEKLRQRSDRILYPAHGPAVTNPAQYLRHLIGHRMQREKQILRIVGEAPRTVPEIVAAAYPGLDPRLVLAAGASVTAHLVDLERRGLVELEGEQWTSR